MIMSQPGIPRAEACVTHLVQGDIYSQRVKVRDRKRKRASREDILDVCRKAEEEEEGGRWVGECMSSLPDMLVCTH